MQKAKRIRTRRVLDVVANDGGHDDGVADSTPRSPVSPAPSRLEAGGLILHSFSLCEIRRFFLSFRSLFFRVLLLAFAFAFVMAHVMKRVVHIETTLSHKTLVSGRVSLAWIL